VNLFGNPSLRELIARAQDAMLEAQQHSDVSFAKLVEALGPASRGIADVMFSYLDSPDSVLEHEGSKWGPIEIRHAPFDARLFITLNKVDSRLRVIASGTAGMPGNDSPKDFVAHFVHAIETLENSLDHKLEDIHRSMTSLTPGPKPVRIAIAATFTAEPLLVPLQFWLQRFGVDADIMFAPLDQVMQTLTDSKSIMNTNSQGLNVVLINPSYPGEESTNRGLMLLESLTPALLSAAARSSANYL